MTLSFEQCLMSAATFLLGLALGAWGMGWRCRRLSRPLQAQLEQALSEARCDPLTGLANRRLFDEELARGMALSRRAQLPLVLVLCDLDGLKQVNDRQGHAAGDVLLQQFADLTRKSVRISDLVARIGGDEFAFLLPRTDVAGALVLLERLRRHWSTAHTWTDEGQASRPPRTDTPRAWPCSTGLAEFGSQDTAEKLFARADAALYRSKQAGGGCIHIARNEQITQAP